MDALDVLKVCLRRWFVMLPVVLIGVGAGLGLASQQQPTYTAFGSYALVFQGTVTELRDPRESNPLGGDGALLLGEALAADLMSGPSQAEFGGVGNSGVEPGEADEGTAYSVSRPDDSETYLVQTWSKDAAGARATVDAVLSAAPDKAIAIQERVGAPKRSHFTAFVTLPTQIVQLPPTSTLKLVIALSGVGVLAGAALSLLVDRLIAASRARRAARPPRVVAWDDRLVPTAPADLVAPVMPEPVPSIEPDAGPEVAHQPMASRENLHVDAAANVGGEHQAGPVAQGGQEPMDEAAVAARPGHEVSAGLDRSGPPTGVGWPIVEDFPGQRHQQLAPAPDTADPLHLPGSNEDPMERLAHERFWEQEAPVLYVNGAEPHANAAEPHANAAEPHANAAEPHANAAEPHANAAEPHANAAEPHANAAEPHANAAEPHANAAEPHANGAEIHANGAETHANGEHAPGGHPIGAEPEPVPDSLGNGADPAEVDELHGRQRTH